MIDSPIYHWIRNEGNDEARDEGRQEGREETRLEMTRKAILDVLANRFDAKVPLSLTKRLNAISDLKNLEALRRSAWNCLSIREFASSLEKGKAN